MTNRLAPFVEGIWTARNPFRFFGFQLGVRMTVVDLTGQGDLLVHSPIKPDPRLVEELDALGKVRYVIAPNLGHHLFVASFKNHYPEAMYFCCPGLDSKRSDLNFDQVIQSNQTYPWSAELDHQLIQGCPTLNEVVFLHKRSQTLIVTDLGLHICDDSPMATRLLFKGMGHFNRFGWSKLEKKLLIKDTPLFGQSLVALTDWAIERIILSHGRMVKADGKAQLLQAFSEELEKAQHHARA